MFPIVAKTTSLIKQKYNAVPTENKRRATYIILLIIMILLFKNKIIGSVRKLFHKDINKLEVNQNNLTYQRGEYFSMCSTLESSMNGTGTQEDSIIDVMEKLKTQDDWNFLQKSFGIREKEGGTFFNDVTGDLKIWLADELSDGDLSDIRSIMQKQGINY